MRRFLISLIFLYAQGTLKAQSFYDTTYLPTGEIRFFDTTKNAWLGYHRFYSGGVAYIDQYDSSNFTYFKTRTAFNLDRSCALVMNTFHDVPTGKYAEYFEHGQPKQIGDFYNGFKSGRWLEYYPNGKIAAEYLFQLTHEDSTFKPQKHPFEHMDDLKHSLMRFEWGTDDANLDPYLKYKNIIIFQFPYFSPTTIPTWKKYNSSGELVETSDTLKKKSKQRNLKMR